MSKSSFAMCIHHTRSADPPFNHRTWWVRSEHEIYTRVRAPCVKFSKQSAGAVLVRFLPYGGAVWPDCPHIKDALTHG